MFRKTHLAAAVGAALFAVGTAAQAQAPITNVQQGASVQLYGQVSRAMMMVDDGVQSKWFNVDGQPSSTRFGILAGAPLPGGMRIGARIETEMKSNPSDTVSMTNASTGAGGNAVAFAERWLDASLEASWGTIRMGQGSAAADDLSTLDLSGTGMPNGNCPTDWAGGIQFRNGSTKGVLAGNLAAVGGAAGANFALGNCNDFESRYDRLLYSTPTFGGFRAQVSYGQKTAAAEGVEFGVIYSGKVAGELQAALGYSIVNTSSASVAAGLDPIKDRTTIGGSITWLHTSGFNLTFQGTQVEGISGVSATTDDRKAKYYNGKVGYKIGAEHAIALDYGIYKDQAQKGDDGKSIGLGYVWTPVRWTEIYAGYHLFSLDRTNTAAGAALGFSIEDITAYVIGTRIRF